MRAKKNRMRVIPQPALVLKPEFRTARLTEAEVVNLITLVGSVWAQFSLTWPVENLAEAHRLLKEAQKRGSRMKSAIQDSTGGGQ